MKRKSTATGSLERQTFLRGGIGRRRVMAWEYGDHGVEYRHSEGREEIQPKPCRVQIFAEGKRWGRSPREPNTVLRYCKRLLACEVHRERFLRISGGSAGWKRYLRDEQRSMQDLRRIRLIAFTHCYCSIAK